MRSLSTICAATLVVLTAGAVAQEKPQVTEMLKGALEVGDGQEVTVKHYNVPAGWASPPHSHSGHVVLYVEDGTAVMEIESEARQGTSGQVIEAAPSEVMIMRNGSDSEPLTFVVFQVNDAGKPYITAAE